jgi:hypothetical protein
MEQVPGVPKVFKVPGVPKVKNKEFRVLLFGSVTSK